MLTLTVSTAAPRTPPPRGAPASAGRAARCALGRDRLALVLLLVLAAPAALAGPLTPEKRFRVRLDEAAIGASVDVDGARALAGLSAEGKRAWPPEGTAGAAALELALPADAVKGGVLVVLDVERPANGDPALALEAGSSARTLKPCAAETLSEPGRRTLRLAAPRGQRALRIVLGSEAAGAPRATARLHGVKLYRLDPRGRNDYWVFVGASIQAGGIKPDAFESAVADRFPGYEPHVANEAVSGWTSGRLRRELDAILARHPHARYVAIHIGGNDITAQRPYPGGAAALEGNLVAILEAVVAAGKVPILSRLSYRSYPAKGDKPGVPPAENGSGPYVERIYDPLIARYCPAFFDRRAGKGVVDLYGWYEQHPNEIGGDGIHLTGTGYKSWARLWLESAGGVVYGD